MNFLYFLMFQFLFFFKLCHAYTKNNSLIIDLEGKSYSDLIIEISSWTISSTVCSSCNKTSISIPNSCGIAQDLIYAGPNILGPSGGNSLNQYFQRQYTGITISGSTVGLQIDFHVFASNQFFTNSNDGSDAIVSVKLNTKSYSLSAYRWWTCSVNYSPGSGIAASYLYKVTYKAFYSVSGTNTLTLQVQNKLSGPSTLNSFGFRNVKIYTGGFNGQTEAVLGNFDTFPCLLYYFWNGVGCEPCHTSCMTCSGRTNVECLTCRASYYNYRNGSCFTSCNGPFAIQQNSNENLCLKACSSSNFYWFHNSSCTSTCPSPLVQSIDANNLKICSNPCYYNGTYFNQYRFSDQTCGTTCVSPLMIRTPYLCLSPCANLNLFVYANGTCGSSCDFPLSSNSSKGVKFCQSSCPTQYLYPNGTCFAGCPSPLIKREMPDITFCINPCPLSQFLYPNSTCKSTCPSPLLSRSEIIAKYCFTPCPSTQYLYVNGSCITDCLPPLIKKEDPYIKLCTNPCSDPASPYLYSNSTCKSSCPSPLLSRSEPGVQYCWSPCSLSQYLFPNSTCKSNCPFPLLSRNESEARFCFNPCTDPVNQFLYPDGTCKSTCPSPLLSRSEPDVKSCWSPCSMTQYLYPNSTCLPDCPSPLASKSEPAAQLCFNPCSDLVNQFLYSDGTCKSNCPSPLLSRSDPDVKYCWSPCSMSQYLYPNSTCKSTCPSPLESKDEAGVRYCKNPCTDPAKPYLYTNSTCKSTCPSPLLSRSEPDVKYCWNPCSSTQFLYPNSTCLSDCNLPLAKRSEPGASYCYNPCDFNTEYLFDNGDCSSQCNSLLSIQIDPNFVKFCQNPCYSNDTFLYPNGSCLSTCPDPLDQKTENGVKYCWNPCSNASDYLYPNKSCSDKCPEPLSSWIEPMAKYCFSLCDDYLYENGSCLPACNSPNIKSQSSIANQCSSPCEDPQKEYFYEATQECKSDCTSPYEYKIINEVKICSQPSQNLEKEEAEKIVSSVQSQRKATEAGMKAMSVLNSGSPSFSWLAGQDTMLFSIRYINLNYTSKLKMVFFLQGSNPFDFSIEIDMPKALEDKLKDRELPEIFERYEVRSNFFYNSWGMLSSGLLVLGIILVVSVVKIFTGKYTKIDKIFAGILASLKWNTLLMVILGSFGSMYFDASMQLQASSMDSLWDILSLGLTVVMILVGLVILALGIKIVNDLWRSRNEENCLEETEKKWKNFELLFEGSKRNSLVSLNCMVIFLGRTVLFNLIIANLYKYPLIQSVLINIISFLMVCYMINKRPLKNTMEFVQLFLNEIFVMIVNTCTLIIAIMDEAHIEGQSLRNDACNTIIAVIIIFTSFNLAFFVVHILVALFSFVKLLRRLKAQDQLNPRGILNALLFENKETANSENKKNKNTPKLPAQVQLQRKPIEEISYNQSELIDNQNVTKEVDISNDTIIPQMNETECHQREISGIFVPPRRYFKPRIIKGGSRKMGQNSGFLDCSTTEMLPSEGPVQTLNIDHHGFSPVRNKQTPLEKYNKDSVAFSGDPWAIPVQEKRDVSLPDNTIAQFRKMRNYLRRNQEKKQ